MSVSCISKPVEVVSLTKWLDWIVGNDNERHVVLPMLQRGSVWKPSQIIDLWDSVLRGFPIGSLMVSRYTGPAVAFDTKKRTEVRDAVAVTDGQQRALALTVAWPRPPSFQNDQFLWIDLSDNKPLAGREWVLRLTTKNQPFGTAQDNPDGKISWEDRRQAEKRRWYIPGFSTEDVTALAPVPFSRRPGLPVPLLALIQAWQEKSSEEDWITHVMGLLKRIQFAESQEAPLQLIYETLSEEARSVSEKTVRSLAIAMERLFRIEIPLIYLGAHLFPTKDGEATATAQKTATRPPLAVLFERVGSNATKLSDADYAYAVLKHLRPELHDYVEALQERPEAHIAALLTPTDLVMTAVRLAAAQMRDSSGEIGQKAADPISPNMEQFHALLKKSGQGDFTDTLIDMVKPSGRIGHWFDRVNETLLYRAGNIEDLDSGFPAHAFPSMGLYLVQVLLRFVQIGYLTGNPVRRAEVLRLVLYWTLCVNDKHKASRVAYEVIQACRDQNDDHLPRMIAREIYAAGCGVRLETPASLERCEGLVYGPNPVTTSLSGWERFHAKDNDDEDKRLRSFYLRWWRPRTYIHPVLLWIQRAYVARALAESTVLAGREEDTAYDYDHILPYAEWGGWTGRTGDSTTLPSYFRPEARGHTYVLGNAVGNIRVWASRDNRSDGDSTPSIKLGCRSLASPGNRSQNKEQLLSDSAIRDDQETMWIAASSTDPEHKKVWTCERAAAFQQVVEKRTFDLYNRLYTEAGFSEWEIPDVTQ